MTSRTFWSRLVGVYGLASHGTSARLVPWRSTAPSVYPLGCIFAEHTIGISA